MAKDYKAQADKEKQYADEVSQKVKELTER